MQVRSNKLIGRLCLFKFYTSWSHFLGLGLISDSVTARR